MSIKEKLKKCEYEYKSPDGDCWNIVIVESADRKYIQFERVDDNGEVIGDRVTMDGIMLLDIADAYRKLTSKTTLVNMGSPTLQAPVIVDHRKIDQQVEASMQKQDEKVEPIQSFSSENKEDYSSFRTGVDVENLKEVGKTPDKWTAKSGEELKSWQKDALERKKKSKKIEAKDLI